MVRLSFSLSRLARAAAGSGLILGLMVGTAIAGSGEPAHNMLKKQKAASSDAAPVQQNWTSSGNGDGKATTETAVVNGSDGMSPFLLADSVTQMQAAIAHYEQIVSAGGWPTVPASRYKKGAKNAGVAALNLRLFAEGYLRKEATEGEFAQAYTSATVDAVSRFQRNNGLAATGIVDKPTLRELNVSADKRLATLRANLPRLTEYTKDLGNRYVVVNVPAMQIETVENGVVHSRHNAIVGRPSRPTPVVMTPLTTVRFNPYWNAPPSIVERDILPSMISGSPSKVMEKMNMKIFKGVGGPEVDPRSVNWRKAVVDDYHFRQEPGGTNAMATAKIEFNSPHGIYLHDTPEPQLFQHGQRFYSSGCVRVEKVAILIDWILRGQDGLNAGRIAELAETKERLDVAIADAPQIRVAYLTAWPTKDGIAAFRPDVYELDRTDFVVGQPLPVGETLDGKRYVLKPIPRSPNAVEEDEAAGFASLFFGRNRNQSKVDAGSLRAPSKKGDSLISTQKTTTKTTTATSKTKVAATKKKPAKTEVATQTKGNWNSAGADGKTVATKKKPVATAKATEKKSATKTASKTASAKCKPGADGKIPTGCETAAKKPAASGTKAATTSKAKTADKCKPAADGKLPKGCEVATKKPTTKPETVAAAAN